MADLVSVIIATYNPDMVRLDKTIAGLRQQTLALAGWELIIVDNNSSPAVNIDLNWHPNHILVKEPKQGLTNARLKGFEQATGNVIVMVDDDNVLDKNYLKSALNILNSDKRLGAAGGKSIPLFESPPPAWLPEFYNNLAIRDLGDNVLTASWQNHYPDCAPIGAGMCLKTAALKAYIHKISQGDPLISDRSGNVLSSGGDNDMILEILKSGWQVGYFPGLQLKHIIPETRMQVNYMARLLNHSNISWVRLLESHGINPWKKLPKWALPLRKIKAWVACRAWKNEINYIRWQAACGLFEGLSVL